MRGFSRKGEHSTEKGRSCSHMVEGTHTQACHLHGSPGEIHILEKRTISRLNTGFSLRVVHTSNLHLHGLHPSSICASARHPNGSISGSGARSYTASVTAAPSTRTSTLRRSTYTTATLGRTVHTLSRWVSLVLYVVLL